MSWVARPFPGGLRPTPLYNPTLQVPRRLPGSSKLQLEASAPSTGLLCASSRLPSCPGSLFWGHCHAERPVCDPSLVPNTSTLASPDDGSFSRTFCGSCEESLFMRLLGAARFQCSVLPSVFFLERGPSSFKIINKRLLSYFSHDNHHSVRKKRARRASDGHFCASCTSQWRRQ